MIKIEIDARQAMQTLHKLENLPMEQVMRGVADTAEQLTRERFRTETTPTGRAWAPHKPATIKARERRGSASRALLVDTGAMYDSIHTEASATEAAVIIGGGEGMFPGVHQNGLGPIPARPFVPTGPDLPPAYLDALTVPIAAAIKKAIE